MTQYYFDTSATAAIAEIKTSLESIAHDIETFHHSGENNLIEGSIAKLQQISGTLNFLSILGGVKICDQMIDSLTYVTKMSITDSGKIVELLITAIFFLDRYIDFVFKNKTDNTVLVLDTVNLLRKAAGQKLIAEHKFIFAPFEDRSIWPIKEAAPKNISHKSQLLLKKIQHIYQVGLLGILKNGDSKPHFKLMAQALSKTYKMTQKYGSGEYWLLTRCLIDVLYKKQVTFDHSIKGLLASINLEFSRLTKYDPNYMDAIPSDEKIFDIYYYLLRSGSDNTAINRICNRYNSSSLIFTTAKIDSDKSILESPDSSVLNKVSIEIEEQLNIVRDKLLSLYSDGDLDDDVLSDLRENLFNINSTLSLLGLNDAAAAIHDIDDDICAILSGSSTNFDTTIASAADSIEAADSMIKSFGSCHQNHYGQKNATNSHFDEALDIVIKESRSNMNKVKLTMEDYMDSYMDPDHISQLPDLLNEIHGALSILEFDQAASIVADCNSYISNSILKSDSCPSDTDIDYLTDSLAGIEWYLESFGEYRYLDTGLLQMANQSLNELNIRAN